MHGGWQSVVRSGGSRRPRRLAGAPESSTPECLPVPHQQYVPKHRAVPALEQPPALAGPRHLGARQRPARKALRTTVTLTGLAAAATGVAVAAGVVHTPGAAVNLADSLTPLASARPPS